MSDEDLACKMYKNLSNLSRREKNKKKKEKNENSQERKYTQFLVSATRPLQRDVSQCTPIPTDLAVLLENIYEQCVDEWTVRGTSQEAEVSQIVSNEPACRAPQQHL